MPSPGKQGQSTVSALLQGGLEGGELLLSVLLWLRGGSTSLPLEMQALSTPLAPFLSWYWLG